MWEVVVHLFEPFSVAFLGTLTGNWIANGAARTKTNAIYEMLKVGSNSLTCCATMPPTSVLLLIIT